MNRDTYNKIKALIDNGPMSDEELEVSLSVMGNHITQLSKNLIEYKLMVVVVLLVALFSYETLWIVALSMSVLFVIGLFYLSAQRLLDSLKTSVSRKQLLNVDSHPEESLDYTNLIMSDQVAGDFHNKVMQLGRSPTLGEYHLLSTHSKCRSDYDNYKPFT